MSLFIKKSFLGIDVGTSFVKVVELSKRRGRINLENYGEISAESLYKEGFRKYQEKNLLFSFEDIARAIKAIITEAHIRTKETAFSIPDFSTFFVNLKLPPMSEEELSDAVRYASRQYIPLPLNEVLLDWTITEGKPNSKEELKVLLAAVPKDLVFQYQKISELTKLHLSFIEAEVFSLARALVSPESKKTIALLDIGAQSTTVNIVERGKLKRSYSFNIAGNHLTRKISNSLSIDYHKAQELKEKIGLLPSWQRIDRILIPLIDATLIEVRRAFEAFLHSEGRDIEEIILSGGSANLPGLKNYIEKEMRKKVSIGNPFDSIFYPPILEKELRKMGPSFSVAVGLAMRGLE